MTAVKPPHLHGTDTGKDYDYESLPDNSSPPSTWRNILILVLLLGVAGYTWSAFYPEKTIEFFQDIKSHVKENIKAYYD